MSESDRFCVEVAYALPDRQEIVMVEVEPGTTAQAAILQSQIERHFPDLQLEGATLGIFGKVVEGGQVLRAGDRVEIYRPLLADPKEVRRRRAEEARARRRSD